MNKNQRMTDETKEKIRKARLKRKELLGYINSLEARQNISKSQKGKTLSLKHRKHISEGVKGKPKPPFTEEHCKNISEGGKMPRPWQLGSKNRFWKGGKSPLIKCIKQSFEYKEWRTKIFRRDNWTCQECGKKGGLLDPHHIIPLSVIIEKFNIRTLEESKVCELLWDINNGITLCRKCHKKTDTYGVKIWQSLKNPGKVQEFSERHEFSISENFK